MSTESTTRSGSLGEGHAVRRLDVYGFRKLGRYLGTFAAYVFRNFPSARFALFIAMIGVVLEYAALSVMVPLAGGGDPNSAGAALAINWWRTIVKALHLSEEPRTWLWLFLVLLAVRIVIGLVQVVANTWVSKNILAQLCSGTFRHVVVDEPLTEIYRRSVGYYTALAGDEAVRVGQVFFHLAQALSAIVAALIGLVVLYFFSPPVFQLTMLFLLLSGLAIGLAMKRIFSWSNESVVLSREANTTFIEALNGIRSIRSMAGETFVTGRYQEQIRRYARVLFLLDVFNHGSRSIPGLILVVLSLVALFPSFGFFGDISVVYFFAATAMLLRVLGFLGTAVSSGGRVAIDIRAAFDLGDLIGTSDKGTMQPTGSLVTSVREVSFSNLSCGYRGEQPVLIDISARLVPGRCYALVGRSGSGKSTLSDVLLGHLLPASGDLRIEHSQYHEINLMSLRRRIVLVEQQTRIFSGTIRENIAFGLDADDAALRRAAKAAGLQEFLSTLPTALDTRIDYQGANLSGGQRQRIGIARAILREPDVLILDEATNGLDAQTRDTLVERLRALFQDRILLFITHDNNIVRVADEIWHIRKGKLDIETRNSVA